MILWRRPRPRRQPGRRRRQQRCERCSGVGRRHRVEKISPQARIQFDFEKKKKKTDDPSPGGKTEFQPFGFSVANLIIIVRSSVRPHEKCKLLLGPMCACVRVRVCLFWEWKSERDSVYVCVCSQLRQGKGGFGNVPYVRLSLCQSWQFW